MTIKAVVFDAYGTLFDVYSIGALAEQLYPSQGAVIATLWRDKQIEYTRLTTMSDPHGATGSKYYQSFQDLTRLALQYTLERLHLAPEPANLDALMQQYQRLTPFPENMAVLEQLKAAGIQCAILSNGNAEMLDSVVASAGMTHLLDHVISVDSIRLFKTAPESYALVQQRIAVQKDEILFVSSNAWDALGATWFGFQTLWINRQNLPFETIGPKPIYSGNNLKRVLEIVPV
ncbi:MAG: 2-haloacid dehalogenase [Janthinobacterium sp.]|jgi:2-haloacid dehalogenase